MLVRLVCEGKDACEAGVRRKDVCDQGSLQ